MENSNYVKQANVKLDNKFSALFKYSIISSGNYLDSQKDNNIERISKGTANKINKKIIRMNKYDASLKEVKKVVISIFISTLKKVFKDLDISINSILFSEIKDEVYKSDIFDNYISEYSDFNNNIKIREQIKGCEEN